MKRFSWLFVVALSLGDIHQVIPGQYAQRQELTTGSTRTDLIRILENAISLNENFKKLVGKISNDSLSTLRQRIEIFNEQYVDSARAHTNNILIGEKDSALFCTYIRYIISSENSADESISRDVAELFVQRPDLFLSNRCETTKGRRGIIKKRIKDGLSYWKYERKYDETRIKLIEDKLKRY